MYHWLVNLAVSQLRANALKNCKQKSLSSWTINDVKEYDHDSVEMGFAYASRWQKTCAALKFSHFARSDDKMVLITHDFQSTIFYFCQSEKDVCRFFTQKVLNNVTSHQISSLLGIFHLIFETQVKALKIPPIFSWLPFFVGDEFI